MSFTTLMCDYYFIGTPKKLLDDSWQKCQFQKVP